ncbi:MAG: sigma-70 family RNA polymerase sigma factor [Oscillospiraceae bacterium]
MQNRNEYIEKNTGLVHSCCHRFKGRGIEYDDLYQAGCIGLIKAVDGFDEGRGLCFSTYAVPAILGEIKRMFRDGGSVKVARSLKELSLKVARQREIMIKRNMQEPTLSELAEELSVTSEEVAEALCASQPTLSLTVRDDDEVSELDLPTESIEDSLFDTITIDTALKTLSCNDREIITLRYYRCKTQSETAKRLGMTQVQVSRRERDILTQMRKLMA